jgi:hypothetical protein
VNKSKLLKYLCKYVNKGPDKATIVFEKINKDNDSFVNQEDKDINKIKEYSESRYICQQDSLWRLLGFDIHYHWPPVERLPVHLPLQNTIKLHENIDLKYIIQDPK